ncbi:MAG: sigma-70 family RNA polymerase sigma factor [Lachnospiraceae bacterium]|nr:sigma-70 family RNA polymerase sigma factor [Lachnospiraceae bacterium]
MDRNQFNEALVSLVEYAGANANHVSTKDIKIYFKDFLTEDSQYQAVYDYLKASKIIIDDLPGYDSISAEDETTLVDSSLADDTSDIYGKEDLDFSEQPIDEAKPLESEEELAFIEMYENEISTFTDITDSERLSLIKSFIEGDDTATEHITNAYLPVVHEIAKSYAGQVISLGDLIQEGNLGLLLALSSFDGDSSDFDSYVREHIRSSIEAALGEQAHSNRIGDHLAGRMNSLDDLSRDLTEKLGRAPSVEELAHAMNISVDEVDTIIRTSLNVLTVAESKNT